MVRPRTRPTTPLFRIIEARALREGVTREDVCLALGISVSYYGQLSGDPVLLAQASRSVIAAIAQFIEVPHVQVQMWAGQLSWTDFGQPRNPGATVTQYIDAIALQIETDPAFVEFAVPIADWSATPQSIKLRYVALYELARQLRLGNASGESTPTLTLARAAGLAESLPLDEVLPDNPLNQRPAAFRGKDKTRPPPRNGKTRRRVA